MNDHPAQQEFFLARQPILDRQGMIVAYKLLFRTSNRNEADVSDDVQATANVIVHAFSDLGLGSVLNGAKGFINFSAEMLMSETIELLPPDQVVIELLETIRIDEAIIERCRELKEKGFSLALDDVTAYDPAHEAIYPLIDIVKLDILQMSQQDIFKTVIGLKRWPVRLLAEKIDSPEQAEHCKKLGFDLFQGYFFAQPAIVSGKRADASQQTLLRLLGQVLNEAETADIEQTLKHDAGLTHNLLRLVNSVAMGLRYKISSIKQAIVVLGRRQLQRWLELLMFVHQSTTPFPSPLLIMAATRGRFMELLAEDLRKKQPAGLPRDFQERAFLVGVMSLLDALLAMPMEEIVAQLNFDEDIQRALVRHDGLLGDMLTLAELLERSDFAGVSGLLANRPGFQLGNLARAQIGAMRWANGVGQENPVG